MGRRLIEVMQVLIDQVHKGGYQHRVLEDSIYAESQKRIAAEKDRDHWRQARQDAIEAGDLMKAEIETLRGAMAADDKRLRDAEERVWPGETRGCDAPYAMADEILYLRQQLAEAQQQDVDAMRAEIERLNKFVWKVRWADCYTETLKALAELDAQPAPVAETAEGGT